MNVGSLRKYDVLLLSALIWFLGKFLRYAFPPLFEPLQASYGVSNAVVGTAFTGFMVVYALMQFPSGLLADWIGSVPVIVAGAVVAGAGALALVVDSPFPVLVAAMLVIGAGTGAHKTVSIRLLSRVYPGHTGRAIGILDTIGALGGVAAPAVLVVFLAPPRSFAGPIGRLPGADWRGPFLLSGVLVLALALAFLARVPGRLADGSERDRTDQGSTPGAGDYLQPFRDPRVSAFVVVTVSVAFAYNGAVAFLPLYLSQEVGVAATTASLLYSVLFAVTFVQLVTGDLSDRVGRLSVIVAAVGVAAAALVGLVLFQGTNPVLLGALVAGIGLGAHGYRPVRSAHLIEILPDWLAGGGLGAVRTLLMTAGAFAPGVVGVVADYAGFRAAFGLLAAALLVATVVSAALWITE